jgi:hypothetical protein
MILNYREPQLNIDQQLAIENISDITRQSAVLVGPQYVSPGFESKFEKSTFLAAGDSLDVSFRDGSEVYTVDENELLLKLKTDSVKLYVENAEYSVINAIQGDFTNGMPVSPGVNPNSVITTEVLKAENPNNLAARFARRNVKIGDIAYVANNDVAGSITRRKVRGFVGKPIASTFGSDDDSDNQQVGNGAGNPVATTGSEGDIISPVSPSSYYLASTVTLAATGSDIKAVNLNGLSVIIDGEVKAGVRLSLRILTFNATNGTGTMSVTSTDGVISGSGTFALAEGVLTFDLSTTSSLHGISSVAAEPFLPGNLPPLIPGQIFAFTILADYTPLGTTEIIVQSEFGYTGTSDNTFYLKVKTGTEATAAGNAVVTAYDARGTFTPFDVTVVRADEDPLSIPVGSGITFTLNREDIFNTPQSGLRKNDIFFVTAKAARTSSVEFTGLILDGPAVTSGLPVAMKLRAVATGEITEENQGISDSFFLSENKTTVSYTPNLKWKIEERPFGSQFVPLINSLGSVYLNWKAALIPSASERVISVAGDSDLTQFGPADVENDIAFAASVAKKVSKNQIFYVLRTAGESSEDFEEALKKIENSDVYYAIACISSQPEAFYTTVEHAEIMSTKTIKNFRKVYFGVDSPGEFSLISEDSEGLELKATVTLYAGSNRYVSFENDIDLSNLDVSLGDIIFIDEQRLIVAQIISENELLVTENSAPALPISPALPASIIKANNPANQIYYVSQIAKNTANRRGSLIWCDKPIGFEDFKNRQVVLPAKFLAAEVAALRIGTPPQLGLTRKEIESVIECPNMYTKFTRDLLNRAAENGVMIVTQEYENGPTFVRHQLTTEVNKGILYYEDSVTTNVDNLSIRLKDTLDKYIGKKNVTPTTLGLISHEVFVILDDARKTTLVDLDTGPQILEFYNELNEAGKVTVKQHPTFRDRVLVRVKVAIPTPLNILEVVIDALSETVTITE